MYALICYWLFIILAQTKKLEDTKIKMDGYIFVFVKSHTFGLYLKRAYQKCQGLHLIRNVFVNELMLKDYYYFRISKGIGQ